MMHVPRYCLTYVIYRDHTSSLQTTTLFYLLGSEHYYSEHYSEHCSEHYYSSTTTTTPQAENRDRIQEKMSKSRLPLYLGLGAAGVGGYYLYKSGGDVNSATRRAKGTPLPSFSIKK
jgi:hypothetical protein